MKIAVLYIEIGSMIRQLVQRPTQLVQTIDPMTVSSKGQLIQPAK